MNAPAKIVRPWNYESGVTTCETCEGHGSVRAYRRPTTNDPYPETPCDCGLGEHEPECPVCGFGIEVPGFDCLVCDLVMELPAERLTAKDAAAIGVAVLTAMQARQTAEAVS